jgi:hypothetical protein
VIVEPARERSRGLTTRRAVWIVVTAIVWLVATWAFWLGYAGDDDLFYARYAHLLHRPPMVWWEFRMPAILAIRAAFLAFGPTEFSAALPSLMASLAILVSVAWFVDWPRTLTWQSQSAMLLAAVIPIDVAFRSYPSANQVSAGLLALGTVSVLMGAARTQFAGAVLLALGFSAHENSFFYVALFCLILLLFDRQRFWRPVALCVVVSAITVGVEALVYDRLLGDPLARLNTSARATSNLDAGADASGGLTGVRFFTWPIQALVFSKQFGFNLIALLATGIGAWRHFTREQRILFATTFAVFAWFGYGSMVPWEYKPLYRQFHYYNCLTFGTVALLPFALGHALPGRDRLAKASVGAAIAFHLLMLSVTGRYGANVDASRALLLYANAHQQQTFLVDVNTMNHLYVLNRFRLPNNVLCLNGPAVEAHLLLNKEPVGTPRHRFPERPVDGIFLNWEQRFVHGFEREFEEFVRTHEGPKTVVSPLEYRWPLGYLVRFIGPRPFMVRSAGSEVSLRPGNTERRTEAVRDTIRRAAANAARTGSRSGTNTDVAVARLPPAALRQRGTRASRHRGRTGCDASRDGFPDSTDCSPTARGGRPAPAVTQSRQRFPAAHAR